MEKELTPFELDDDQLENVSGGYEAGDVVTLIPRTIAHCPRCGRLLSNLSVTIDGVRAIEDDDTLYWVTYSCCGHKTSEPKSIMH